VKAPEEQHCGRLTDHLPHGHAAHKREVVEICACFEERCVCTPDDTVKIRRRQVFHCTGKLVTSVTPDLPTEVNL
jgi:hypothetical protein